MQYYKALEDTDPNFNYSKVVDNDIDIDRHQLPTTPTLMLLAPLSILSLPRLLPRNLRWNLVERIKYTWDADTVFKAEVLLEGCWKWVILKVVCSNTP
jgi:hypothetical protein